MSHKQEEHIGNRNWCYATQTLDNVRMMHSQPTQNSGLPLICVHAGFQKHPTSRCVASSLRFRKRVKTSGGSPGCVCATLPWTHSCRYSRCFTLPHGCPPHLFIMLVKTKVSAMLFMIAFSSAVAEPGGVTSGVLGQCCQVRPVHHPSTYDLACVGARPNHGTQQTSFTTCLLIGLAVLLDTSLVESQS